MPSFIRWDSCIRWIDISVKLIYRTWGWGLHPFFSHHLALSIFSSQIFQLVWTVAKNSERIKHSISETCNFGWTLGPPSVPNTLTNSPSGDERCTKFSVAVAEDFTALLPIKRVTKWYMLKKTKRKSSFCTILQFYHPENLLSYKWRTDILLHSMNN